MKTPESYEKADVDKYLASLGAYVVKQTTFGMGASGHADRIVCLYGVFWALEIKREGKTPTCLQELRMQQVQAAGGQTAWGTADKVIAEIEAWRKRFSSGGPL